MALDLAGIDGESVQLAAAIDPTVQVEVAVSVEVSVVCRRHCTLLIANPPGKLQVEVAAVRSGRAYSADAIFVRLGDPYGLAGDRASDMRMRIGLGINRHDAGL